MHTSEPKIRELATCRNLSVARHLHPFTRIVDASPTHVPPRPPPGPPRLAPRLPRPCLPMPRLRAPRLPARSDACHASIVSSHVVSARVKRAAPLVPRHHPACLPARYALRYALRSRLREPPRLLEPATLRPCDPVRLCTYAFTAPQEAAHSHSVPSQPSHPWLNPLSPPPSPHTPQKATSQTLNKPRSAASLHHNT